MLIKQLLKQLERAPAEACSKCQEITGLVNTKMLLLMRVLGFGTAPIRSIL